MSILFNITFRAVALAPVNSIALPSSSTASVVPSSSIAFVLSSFPFQPECLTSIPRVQFRIFKPSTVTLNGAGA